MIDTQAIRKKILDLALRGKLTEQRPEDGTAEELFQQIQAQKNTYIANKDTKKANVSVPISDDEVPFNKPESWKWVRLGEIVIIKTGKRDANFGSINGKYEFFTCAKEPIKCNSFSFSGEALLLAGNGDIGNISYYYGEFEAYQRTYVLQPYLENVYLRYLYYYLGQFTRNYTQTVKRAADNKRRYAPGWVHSTCLLRGFPKGAAPHLAHDFAEQSVVCYTLCRRCPENTVAAGEGKGI